MSHYIEHIIVVLSETDTILFCFRNKSINQEEQRRFIMVSLEGTCSCAPLSTSESFSGPIKLHMIQDPLLLVRVIIG